MLPCQGERLIDPFLVDEFDLQGAVGVDGQSAAREHHLDLELGR